MLVLLQEFKQRVYFLQVMLLVVVQQQLKNMMELIGQQVEI